MDRRKGKVRHVRRRLTERNKEYQDVAKEHDRRRSLWKEVVGKVCKISDCSLRRGGEIKRHWENDKWVEDGGDQYYGTLWGGRVGFTYEMFKEYFNQWQEETKQMTYDYKWKRAIVVKPHDLIAVGTIIVGQVVVADKNGKVIQLRSVPTEVLIRGNREAKKIWG